MYKKITTTIVEEHYAPEPKAQQWEDNEEDVIKVNIPLMIRLLEFAREDAEGDVALHLIVENMIELSEYGNVLGMKDYEEITKC